MHAISSYRGNSPTNAHTNTPTGAITIARSVITIHCAAASAQCSKELERAEFSEAVKKTKIPIQMTGAQWAADHELRVLWIMWPCWWWLRAESGRCTTDTSVCTWSFKEYCNSSVFSFSHHTWSATTHQKRNVPTDLRWGENLWMHLEAMIFRISYRSCAKNFQVRFGTRSLLYRLQK